MHIVVCVKQVPDATEVRIDPKTNTLVREGIPSIVNPYDLHAVEAAVLLREQWGGKVTVLSMGPPQAAEALQKCVGQGADEAILLTDRAFAGADTLATSYALAKAIETIAAKEPVDLVLTGRQAIDGDTGQVGPGIAARLGLPVLTYVCKIRSIDLTQRRLVAERLLEEGREVVESRLPALLTVVKEIAEPRYASLPSLLRAARYKVQAWNKDDIQADAQQLGLKGSPTVVGTIFSPPGRQAGPQLEGEPQAIAAQLVHELAARGIIGIQGPVGVSRFESITQRQSA
ncbi:MAG: electron transfer flavoprotein subunit beta/FixA family protein [Limnochordaceae bacterium]|nr:electron transfer flavoprotein subunit beta/FixA family protein [Limnochordaceae bacterium]